MLFRKTVAVYCKNHTKHNYILLGRMQSFSMLKQVVHIVTYLSVCLSVCPSVAHLSIYLIYGSTSLVDLDRFFSFLIYTQSVGFLGRGISPS
jgi:hypothetical protein